MRRLLFVVLALLVVAGCHRRRHHNWVPDDDSDSSAPVVTSTSPARDATGVAADTDVRAFFSQAMNDETVTSATFLVTGSGGSPVAGSVSYVPASRAARFLPSSPLDDDTLYSARITTGVENSEGQAMDVDYVWSFRTAGESTPPVVDSTIPDTDETGVPINSTIYAHFNKAMNGLTIDDTTFTLTYEGEGTVSVPGTVSYDEAGHVAGFLPDFPLDHGILYTATVTVGVQDTFGNPLEFDYVWTFTTTTDAIRPTVACTIPDDGDVDVAINRKFVVYFSEAMDDASISDASVLVSGPDALPVTGVVSYDAANRAAQFLPDAPLAAGLHTATVTAEVTDLGGNTMEFDYVWTFTVGISEDLTLPSVISTLPADGAIDVPLNARVTAIFDEPMDSFTLTPTTFTFTLLQDATTPVDGIVVVPCPGTSATFIPATDLLPETAYEATITLGALDLAGNTLEFDFVWTFTTGTSAMAGQLPVDLAAAEPFVILAYATITNDGPTIITGDVGLYPGTDIVGLMPGGPGLVVGTQYGPGDPIVLAAKGALTDAYTEAAGRDVNRISCPGELGGLTLAPGLYNTASSTGISSAGILTLDAQGDENAVWVFQVGVILSTTDATSIVLSGGAQAKNVFWIVAESATIGTTCIFKGNILVLASISLNTGATLDGRALAQTGEVTLLSNLVTKP